MDSEMTFWLVAAVLAVAGWIAARLIAKRLDREYVEWVRDRGW